MPITMEGRSQVRTDFYRIDISLVGLPVGTRMYVPFLCICYSVSVETDSTSKEPSQMRTKIYKLRRLEPLAYLGL